MNQRKIIRCDIFCKVVDNFGDIGVSWRLARQLAGEFGLSVRLWVDDLASFKRLCPALDIGQNSQLVCGVEIHHWIEIFPHVEAADLVIVTFACELPESYVNEMAACEEKPVWINLEYLSAEDWVAGCHGLPSPHPRLPLVKYFFFPGFAPETGGLLLEQNLLARRDAFQSDMEVQNRYWKSLGVPAKVPEEVRISLFSYENPSISELLKVWERGNNVVRCMVPEGRILPQIAAYFGLESLQAGDVLSRGNLHEHILSFVEQDAYDLLLWACDVNFVRGEDSCVRAQWAGKPFIWHIYPQHDGVHMKKLQALLDCYSKALEVEQMKTLQNLWMLWNQGDSSIEASQGNIGEVWNNFMSNWSMFATHGQAWAQSLVNNNLALNLLDFSHKVGKMRAFEIQAGRQT